MAKKNKENRLKDIAEIASFSIKEKVRDAKIPDIKIPDIKAPSIKNLEIKKPEIKKPEIKLSEIKAPEQLKNLMPKKDKKLEEAEAKKAAGMISTKSAIRIIYYLMAVDGKFVDSEEEQFAIISTELHPSFADDKQELLDECNKQLKKAIDQEDYYDVIQDGVERAINTTVCSEDTFITPKLLLWDLLTIAYSDDEYADEERKLIKYIARRLDVDKAVFLEMESSIATLIDLEKEQKWLKTTDRPYLTIEAMVNEIADRKNVIFESVKDLIAL